MTSFILFLFIFFQLPRYDKESDSEEHYGSHATDTDTGVIVIKHCTVETILEGLPLTLFQEFHSFAVQNEK